MTAPTSPLPASPLRAEPEVRDLDARIEQAEQRLIAREAGLRRRAGALGERVRAAWQPGRLLAPLLVSAGVAMLGWLWRGRAAPAPRNLEPAPAPARAPADGGHGHWVHLLPLLWPLVPQAWRARVPPSLGRLAVGVGLPLLELLLHRRPPAPLATVGPLELARLSGRWYEVARRPATRRRAGQPLWQHTLRAGGVIEMLQQRAGPRGDVRRTQVVATALPGSGGARLRISEPSPARWFGGSYELAVLHLDDTAGELVLGSPGRDRLRLLSRRPQLPPGRLQALIEVARDRGFDVERLQFVDDAGGA